MKVERERLASESRKVLERIWDLTYGLKVDDIHEVESILDSGLSARVSVSGAWNGQVCLLATEDLLSQLLIAACGGQLVEGEIEGTAEDTLKDLAQMVAGNLNNVIPEPYELSVAEVVAWNSERAESIDWKNAVLAIELLSHPMEGDEEGEEDAGNYRLQAFVVGQSN